MPEITFQCTEDDEAWLKAQADEVGVDDVAMMARLVIRDARKRGIGFGIVAADPNIAAAPKVFVPRVAYVSPPPQPVQFAQPQQAEEFEFQPQASDDEVEATLAEANSAVDAMLAKAQPPEQPALVDRTKGSFRQRAAAFKSSAAPAPMMFEGQPGSRTAVVDAGDLLRVNSRELAPQDQVAQQNLKRQSDGHYGRAVRH